ncbi:transcription factor IIIB 70 kDa subunit [[Candida] jaroonii]|uniref:Transcription factor IIIB 70 kDa subunit n=1 Tax=[Candida] jaroonii TaxID=467808 RepID=A0ACA9Y938_9ASCO|nr:transcription factor IIIB 70 kDa subunit [[Candida] jaroonii]
MYDICSKCGQASLQADMTGNSGALTCIKCGFVAHESPMVSELIYSESSSGATSVQGTMVGAGQARANVGGRQNAMDSREQTLATGKRNIRDLATALRIPDYIFESACGWFKLALSHNFVQGRRSQNVTAACLYIACRKEKTHHMLIDFSSKLQISVFSLGATFLKMVKTLHIVKLPLADPSLFISHFVDKLGFEDPGKINVIRDATQLAKRMSADWIHEGRRPAGVAGACVLLASRMNGYRRTNNEIVAVAHVAEDTLARRLREFRETDSGSLSIAEFRKGHSRESGSNPPSFNRGVDLETKLRKKVLERKKDIKRIIELNKQLEEEKEEQRAAETAAERADVDTEISEREASESETDKEASNSRKTKGSRRLDSLRRVSKKPSSSSTSSTEIEGRKTKSKIIKKDSNSLFKALLKDCDFSNDELEEHVRRIELQNKYNINNKVYEAPSQSQDFSVRFDENKPINLVARLPKTAEVLQKVSSDADLDDIDIDIDDGEYFNDASMVKKKELIWVKENFDYLLDQERKRLKAESDELAGNTSARKPKRQRKKSGLDVVTEGGINEDGQIESEESAKKISRKLNYLNLDSIDYS